MNTVLGSPAVTILYWSTQQQPALRSCSQCPCEWRHIVLRLLRWVLQSQRRWFSESRRVSAEFLTSVPLSVPMERFGFGKPAFSNTKCFTEQFPLSSTKLLICLCETLEHGKKNIPIGDKALKYKWGDFSSVVNARFLTQLMWRTEYAGICL